MVARERQVLGSASSGWVASRRDGEKWPRKHCCIFKDFKAPCEEFSPDLYELRYLKFILSPNIVTIAKEWLETACFSGTYVSPCTQGSTIVRISYLIFTFEEKEIYSHPNVVSEIWARPPRATIEAVSQKFCFALYIGELQLASKSKPNRQDRTGVARYNGDLRRSSPFVAK